MSLVQNLIEGDIDIQAFSLFFNADASTDVPRRLNLPVHSLSHYEQYLEALKSVYTQTDGMVTVNGVNIKPVTVAVRDAIDAAILGDYKTQLEQQIASVAGGKKSYKTYALMVADKANIPTNSTVDVTNDTAENNGAYNYDGTTFTKSAYDPLTQAKSYTDTAKTAAISTAATDATTKANTAKSEAITAAATDATSKANAAKSEAINTVYTYVDTLVDVVAKATKSPQVYFGSAYPDTWLKGAARTTLGTHIAYTGTTSRYNYFNKVKADVFNNSTGKVYYRLYTGAQISTNGGVATGAAYTTSGECLSFPNSLATALDPIVLDKIIKLPENTKFLLVFVHELATPMSLGYFASANVPSGLTATPFIYGTSATAWSSYLAPATSNFNQAAFKLVLDYSVSGVTPPVVETFTQQIILPPKIYAVENIETNIYFKHTVDCDWTIFDYDVSCSKGYHRANRWKLKPTSGVTAGEHDYSLSCFDKQTHTSLATATAKLVIADVNAHIGVNKKVMMIGDSWTAAGTTTQTLLDNAGVDVMDITLLGTKGTGTNKHEGRSGWTVARYFTNDIDNAFWNAAKSDFDYPNYLSVNSIAAPDFVIIQLGINDVISAANNNSALSVIAAAKTNIDKMIASIKLANTNVKIAISTPPTQGDQNAWDYSSGTTAWRAQINMWLWEREIINYYKDKEVNNIYVVGTGFGLDVLHNFPTETITVNERSIKTETTLSDPYHATSDGYKQIGDQLFAFIKAV